MSWINHKRHKHHDIPTNNIDEQESYNYDKVVVVALWFYDTSGILNIQPVRVGLEFAQDRTSVVLPYAERTRLVVRRKLVEPVKCFSDLIRLIRQKPNNIYLKSNLFLIFMN